MIDDYKVGLGFVVPAPLRVQFGGGVFSGHSRESGNPVLASLRARCPACAGRDECASASARILCGPGQAVFLVLAPRKTGGWSTEWRTSFPSSRVPLQERGRLPALHLGVVQGPVRAFGQDSRGPRRQRAPRRAP
jgi:hypothetical protein